MSEAFPMVPLGEILAQTSRPETVEPDKVYRILGAHWYAEGLYIKETKLGTEIQADKVYRIEQGDFVYNRLFAWKGSFAVATTKDDGCYVSNEFPSFSINRHKVSAQYLQRYFCGASVWDEALGLSSGGTPTSRNRLKENKLLSMRIPLPPLEEQQRTVAQIEELVAMIEKAQGLHRKAIEASERLLLSTVATLLKPDQWFKSTLSSLLRESSLNGLSTRPSDTPTGVPILRISAATSRQDFLIDEEDYKYIELDEQDYLKYKVEPGDILVCRFNGNLHFVGRFALYKQYSGKTHVYPDKLIRLRVDTEKILPEFLCLTVNSPIGRQSIEAFCATTAGNIGISAGNLKSIPIAVPSLKEQKYIVEYFHDLQSKVDTLKHKQAETSAKLDAILPSILDKAFKGEL